MNSENRCSMHDSQTLAQHVKDCIVEVDSAAPMKGGSGAGSAPPKSAPEYVEPFPQNIRNVTDRQTDGRAGGQTDLLYQG